MKKILFTLAIVMVMVSASAQSDGFFRGGDDNGNREPGMPNVPTGYNVGTVPDSDAVPLGNGIAVLTALGVGYALKRNKR